MTDPPRPPHRIESRPRLKAVPEYRPAPRPRYRERPGRFWQWHGKDARRREYRLTGHPLLTLLIGPFIMPFMVVWELRHDLTDLVIWILRAMAVTAALTLVWYIWTLP